MIKLIIIIIIIISLLLIKKQKSKKKKSLYHICIQVKKQCINMARILVEVVDFGKYHSAIETLFSTLLLFFFNIDEHIYMHIYSYVVV